MVEWFNSVLGEAVGTYAAIGVGLLIVIILIIILLRVLRSFSGGMFGNKSQNRLGVIEAAAVDNKRRLVLVRRDNVEHLIMIGLTVLLPHQKQVKRLRLKLHQYQLPLHLHKIPHHKPLLLALPVL